MRHRSKIGMARSAGLGAVTAFGLLLLLVVPSRGQDRTGNAGDTTRGARPGNQAIPGAGQDAQMLIAHGLEMAIEGSTLQALATRSGGAIVGSAPGATRPVAVVGTRVVTPGTAASGVSVTTVPPATDATGRPLVGAPAVAVVTRPAGSTTVVGSTPVAPVAPADPYSVPMITGPSPAMLRQQAQHSFDDSDRMFALAAREPVADPRFRDAATRYVATLRNFGAVPATPVGAGLVGNGTGGSGTFPSATSATGVGGTGNPVTGPGGVAAATGSPTAVAAPGGIVVATGVVTDLDLASVAAINHAVKEAIAALRIRQMFRAAGSSDSPAAQSLLTHARQMETQSRSMIQAMLAGGGTAAVGPVQALAQQANDVIQTLQGAGG